MNTVAKIFIFLAGAAVGVLATREFYKEKYKEFADEEIRSVKETFSKMSAEKPKKQEPNDKPSEEEVTEYKTIVNIYSKGGDKETVAESKTYFKNINEEGDSDMKNDGPYVISPEEFGSIDEYDQISLNYHSNNILVDEDGHPIEDVEYMVGEDSLNHFGEYEDDSVFVRNDKLKMDFEILLVEDPFIEEE